MHKCPWCGAECHCPVDEADGPDACTHECAGGEIPGARFAGLDLALLSDEEWEREYLD